MPPSILVTPRLYYQEQSLLEFTAEVTEIRELARLEGKPLFQIALNRTAFYPTSGGQPHDTGTLSATARSGAVLEAPITSVDEDSPGEVWHTTAKPLQPGTVVTGRVDGERRLDHMQQHSGQHLLSAVLLRETGAATVSFHLGEVSSTIDLATAEIAETTVLRIQRMVSQSVAQALPISQRTVPRAEAERLLFDGKIRKLPPREGNIRLVEIAGIDLNACGGTHVSTTAEIGPVLLRGMESVRGNVRLSFLCGQRALSTARREWVELSSAAEALSTSATEVAAQVRQVQEENRAAAKAQMLLLRAAASLQAPQLASRCGEHIEHTLSSSDLAADAVYAKLLAARLSEEGSVNTAIVLCPKGEQMLVVLAARRGQLNCGTLLRDALAASGGRGGGSAELAQGSVPVTSLTAVLASLRQRFEAVG